MPTPGAIRAGRAFVELYLDKDALTRGLRTVGGDLTKWGAQMSAAGRQLIMVAAAMAAPIGISTAAFASLDDQLRSVQAVTGATGQAFERLTGQARELGRTTSFTASEVAGGMLSLGRSGFKPAEIEAAIPAVMNLSRATGTDLAQSADIASGTLRAFNLEASEMTRVADVMVATANNSAQTLEDLGESMKYAAPIAAEYGLTLEETSKALGVMANLQIKGSMAGTSMRMILLKLSDPAIQQRLAQLGVTADDFGEKMIQLGEAAANLSGPQRVALFKDLFDQRAAGAALKLARGGFEDLAEAIDNAGGVADRTAKQMDAGIGGVLRRLWSAVEGLMLAFAEGMSGTLSQWGEWLTATAGKMTAWIAENQEAVVGYLKLTAVIAAAGTALLALGVTFGALSAIVSGLTLVVHSLSLAIKSVAAAATFLAGHPLLALTVVVGGGLLYAFVDWEAVLGKVGSALKNLLPDLSALGSEAAKTAEQIRAEDAAMRLKAERLAELRGKQTLSNAEQVEAKTLAAELQAAYPKLATALEDVGRSAEGTARFMKLLNEQLLQNTVSSYEAQLKQIEERLEELNRKRAAIAEARGQLPDLYREQERAMQRMGPIPQAPFFDPRTRAERAIAGPEALVRQFPAISAEIAELQEQAEQLEEVISRLREPPAAEKTKIGPTPTQWDRYLDASLAVEEQLSELKSRIRIDGIEDAAQREMAVIAERYEREMKKARELDGLKRAMMVSELERLRKIEMQRAAARQLERQQEEARRKADERAARGQDYIDEILRLKIEEGKTGKDRELALLDLERRRELRTAEQQGINPDLVNMKYDILRRGIQEPQIESAARGTFSSMAASFLGGGGVQEKQLAALETNVKQTDELIGILKRGGLAWAP